jgi:hypothetical protein
MNYEDLVYYVNILGSALTDINRQVMEERTSKANNKVTLESICTQLVALHGKICKYKHLC